MKEYFATISIYSDTWVEKIKIKLGGGLRTHALQFLEYSLYNQ